MRFLDEVKGSRGKVRRSRAAGDSNKGQTGGRTGLRPRDSSSLGAVCDGVGGAGEVAGRLSFPIQWQCGKPGAFGKEWGARG